MGSGIISLSWNCNVKCLFWASLIFTTVEGSQSLAYDDADCLFANSPTSIDPRPAPNNRISDPYNVGNDANIISAINGLGLSDVKIEFIGCPKCEYKTLPVPVNRPTHIHILYPLVDANKDTTSRIGPLIHELGHVKQLVDMGLPNLKLFKAAMENSSLRIELGADFIAGLVFKRYLFNIWRQNYVRSQDLLGNYMDNGDDNHASPEARLNAFRMGFYFKEIDRDIGSAHKIFQNDYFQELIDNAPQL